MAKSSIKVRAKDKKGVTQVKALISHPMETGLRKNKKTGKKIPAHFIQEVVAKSGDKVLMTAYWGGSVSKNPYMAFKTSAVGKGDEITLSWVDNMGGKDSKTAKVK